MKRLSIALVLLLAACSADLTLPPKIDGVVPPTPENLQVTTTDNITFDLTWDISDPTVVSLFRVYWVFGGPPELVTTVGVDTTSVQVSTKPPVSLPGVIFGVTSVSTDNIEGQAVFAVAE